MPQDFLTCDRDQLMPPDSRAWLPRDHLAWFVLAAVAQMAISIPMTCDYADMSEAGVALVVYAVTACKRSHCGVSSIGMRLDHG